MHGVCQLLARSSLPLYVSSSRVLGGKTNRTQVVVIMVFGVPESPRYLYAKGRNEEALQVLCDVYDGTPDDQKIAREQKDILDALALERLHGEYQYATGILLCLWVQSLTSISTGGARSSSEMRCRLEDAFSLPMACSS